MIGAVTWFWILTKDQLLGAINLGAKKQYGNTWYNIGKFLYVPLAVILCLIAVIFRISF